MEQKKFYMDHKGQVCPFCKKKGTLDAGHVEISNDTATQDVTCTDPECNHTWTDLYKLEGIDEDNVYVGED